jgi:hypothetical protein
MTHASCQTRGTAIEGIIDTFQFFEDGYEVRQEED